MRAALIPALLACGAVACVESGEPDARDVPIAEVEQALSLPPVIIALEHDADLGPELVEVVNTQTMQQVSLEPIQPALDGDFFEGIATLPGSLITYTEQYGTSDGYHALVAFSALTGQIGSSVPLTGLDGIGEIVIAANKATLYSTYSPTGGGDGIIAATLNTTGDFRGQLNGVSQTPLPDGFGGFGAIGVAVSPNNNRLLVSRAGKVNGEFAIVFHLYDTHGGGTEITLQKSRTVQNCTTSAYADVAFVDSSTFYAWDLGCATLQKFTISSSWTMSLAKTIQLPAVNGSFSDPYFQKLVYFHSHAYVGSMDPNGSAPGKLYIVNPATNGFSDMGVNGTPGALAQNPAGNAVFISIDDGDFGDGLSRITNYATTNNLYEFAGPVQMMTMSDPP
jgi:hypothetical protein